MYRKILIGTLVLVSVLIFFSCQKEKEIKPKFTGAKGEVKLMTLDPGHFHAALVQKKMYDQVDPVVYVYAPDGMDLDLHLQRIEQYNNRPVNPTHWIMKVYRGPDYLEKMLQEKPGNVMITAGNNKKKTQYIKAAVDAGINVLADKPMCINPEGFELLKQAFESAKKNGVLLYDIMTERSEITTILQRELSMNPAVFGELEKGTPDNPAVTKESVHHFFKYVSGKPLKRPAWYYDVTQQGEGIVDVTTHLVDLVQWECFPEDPINYQTDIELISAKRWPTKLTPEQFEKSTGVKAFPDFLQKDVKEDGLLHVYANGEINYKLRGVHVKISVIWNYQAPEGGGDTHFSIMRGTKANLIIRQGKEQNYRPELYIEPVKGKTGYAETLKTEFAKLQKKYPGIELKETDAGWQVLIPDKYRVGHEAHFGQVMERFLQYLVDGKLPDWEVPNMIAKYYTTTEALKLAHAQK